MMNVPVNYVLVAPNYYRLGETNPPDPLAVLSYATQLLAAERGELVSRLNLMEGQLGALIAQNHEMAEARRGLIRSRDRIATELQRCQGVLHETTQLLQDRVRESGDILESSNQTAAELQRCQDALRDTTRQLERSAQNNKAIVEALVMAINHMSDSLGSFAERLDFLSKGGISPVSSIGEANFIDGDQTFLGAFNQQLQRIPEESESLVGISNEMEARLQRVREQLHINSIGARLQALDFKCRELQRSLEEERQQGAAESLELKYSRFQGEEENSSLRTVIQSLMTDLGRQVQGAPSRSFSTQTPALQRKERATQIGLRPSEGRATQTNRVVLPGKATETNRVVFVTSETQTAQEELPLERDRVAGATKEVQTEEQTPCSLGPLEAYLKAIDGQSMSRKQIEDQIAQLLHLPKGKMFALPTDVYNQLSDQHRGKELVLFVLKATWEYGVEQILTRDQLFLIDPKTNSPTQAHFVSLEKSQVLLNQICDFLVTGARLLKGTYRASLDSRVCSFAERLLSCPPEDQSAPVFLRSEMVLILSLPDSLYFDLQLLTPKQRVAFLARLRNLLDPAYSATFLQEAYARLFWTPELGYSQETVIRRLLSWNLHIDQAPAFSLLVQKWNAQHPLRRQTFEVINDVRLSVYLAEKPTFESFPVYPKQ